MMPSGPKLRRAARKPVGTGAVRAASVMELSILSVKRGGRVAEGAQVGVGQSAQDRIQCAVQAFAVEVIVQKSQNADVLSQKEACARSVVSPRFRCAVLTAIQFDRQLGSRAVEVEVVGLDWVLAAEREPAQLRIAQMYPQLDLVLRSSRAGGRVHRYVCSCVQV